MAITAVFIAFGFSGRKMEKQFANCAEVGFLELFLHFLHPF